jgi:hypothetical protein
MSVWRALLGIGVVGGCVLLMRFLATVPGTILYAGKTENAAPHRPAWTENARLVGLRPASGRARNAVQGTKPSSAPDSVPSEPARPPISTYVVVVPSAGVPSETDLRSTHFRSELLEKYGPADMTAAWLDGGVFNERFIYTGPNKSAVVFIRDGQVVNVRTD